MPKVCEYYFSPQSPFAYFGHARLIALAKQHGVQIDLRPCDLGKIFSVSGGMPLAKRPPQRQAYRLVELKRWSDFLQMPINLQPKFLQVPAEAAAKLIIATQLAHGTDAALEISGALMRAVWVEEKNIADEDTLSVIATLCGHDGKSLVKSSETASVQAEYDRFTDSAIAANVFSVPWYVFNDENFWGQDRLDFVERAFAK